MDTINTKETHMKITPEIMLAASRGFDCGNYANAYETQDYDQFRETHLCDFTGVNGDVHDQFATLGFFASYELHEVPVYMRGEVATLRIDRKLKQIAAQTGIASHDDDDE